jgi:hypothetical protein
MSKRIASAAAILSVLGTLAWLASSPLGGGERPGDRALASPSGSLPTSTAASAPLQSREGGSEVPCDTPLAWRIARVDDGFGLTVAKVRAAVQRAADVWETAVGRPLFVHDLRDGFPIRLVFDERQAYTHERLAREAELRQSGERLDRAVAAFRDRDARRARAQADYERLLRDHTRRAGEHNGTVRQWAERGGAPRDVVEALRSAEASLTEERATLESVRSSLEAELADLRREEGRVERMIEDREREIDEVTARFPPTPVESGLYREAVRLEDGQIVSVRREIRVYRFDDENDLGLVVGHELGHALGLGHRTEAGALMSEEYRASVDLTVRPAEAERLRTLCEAAEGRR